MRLYLHAQAGEERPHAITRSGRGQQRWQALSGGLAARYDHRLMGIIKVALAEDNALLRDGVARLVRSQDDLELSGTA